MSLFIPQELVEQLKSGNVVLFCGAGISASKGGLPSGRQLAQELAARAGEPELVNAPLPEVAQAYKLKLGLHSLIVYVADRIDDPRYTPLRTHQLIAALPFTKIITANWDNLLEKALDQAGKPLHTVVRDLDVAFVDEAKVLLVKLHGSVEQKGSIIITEDDYYDVFARLPVTANLVRNFFATKTILFLGFGLADDDFKRLYREVTRHIGIHKRRAYAVQLDIDELTAKYWEEQNVQIIAADATAFLEALADALGQDIVPVTRSSELIPGAGRKPRRIDAALPSQAQVGKPIALVIAVKLPGSRVLDDEEIDDSVNLRLPEDTKVVSGPVIVEFPVDERTGWPASATLEIQVIAPYFEIHGPKRKSLSVFPDRDSELCAFPLIPQRPGKSEVCVELYSQGDLTGTLCLETMVRLGPAPAGIWTVIIVPAILIIAPSAGMAFATLQLDPAGPPSKPKRLEQASVHQHDVYSIYETGLCQLLNEMTRDHPRYSEALVYQQRLIENIAKSRLHGDTDTRRAERVEIIERLNALALSVLSMSFSELCGLITPTTKREPAERLLERLYAEAKQAKAKRDWSQAIELFSYILNIDKDYEDTSQLLAEAKEQKKLVERYDQAMAHFRDGDWTQAANLFRQILQTDQDHRDALQRLTQAEKQQHLEQLYVRVRQAEADKDWPRMITLCREIVGIAPYYRDVQRLFRKARLHSALHAEDLGASPKIRVLVLIVLVLGAAVGMWISVSGKLSPIVWPLAPTPTIPPVKVEAFLVTRGAEMITTRPGTEITVTVGETVIVTVEVSTTAEEAKTALEFIWYTCRTENGPVLRTVGNPEMFYIAPNEPGPDCICVAVEKGGTRLDRQRIFVDIQQ